jgi:hypothetical protein
MRLFAYLFCLSLLSACASTGTVYPFEDGIYKSVAEDESRKTANNAALKSAKKTCEDDHLRLAIIEKHTNYDGLMSEKQNDLANTALAAATAATGQYYGSAGGTYTAIIKFKCT